MDRSTELELARRALAHIAARTTDRDAGPTKIEAAAYFDEARHTQEVDLIFRRLPLVVGRASQIPEPGDYFVHDATGVPLLVVREEGGRIGAFVNVCRHRGTRVEQLPCGNRKSFVCPYHGWTYGRDGRLVGIPHSGGFDGIDREARGLARVPAAEHAGFVWAVPSVSDAELDVASWLGPLGAELDGLGVTAGHQHASITMTKDLSWKLAIDVFLETYHLKSTHGGSIYGIFFDNIGLVDRDGPHLRNIFPKRSIRDFERMPVADWILRRHANILYCFFPNTLVLVEPDHSVAVHVFPAGPGRSTILSYMLVPERPITDKALAYWAANDKILRDATEEDFAMGESIQRGLASGANREIVFGAFEHALAHFHAQVDRFVTGTTPPG